MSIALSSSGSSGFLPGRAARGVPGGVQGAAERLVRLDRHVVARPHEDVRVAAAPDVELLLVACHLFSDRLRSVSLTSSWMPIFFQCWATISIIWAYGRNAAATVVTVRRKSWPLSVRSRNPSGSFLVSPTLSSSSFACLTSSVDHLVRHSGPAFSGEASSPINELGVAIPRKNASLNWSRSMPIESARRKSALVSHFRISGSASKL